MRLTSVGKKCYNINAAFCAANLKAKGGEFLQDIFISVAEFWHELFGFIQNPLLDFWKGLLGVPGLGDALKFFEEVFGRGATPL